MTKDAESKIDVLKDQVADGDYVVEPAKVADAIVRRLQFVLVAGKGAGCGLEPQPH